MDLVLPLLIGIALSMDCFAVSLAIGTSSRGKLLETAFVIAASFCIFQAGMTLLGWVAGSTFAGFIEEFDHWLAFVLLALIGIKMIIEGIRGDEEDDDVPVLAFLPVIILSLATSIDALAVGVSFAVLRMEVFVPALIIGLVAFALSFIGVIFGLKLKDVLGKRIEILGGLILIAIGFNILLPALFRS